MAEGSAASPKGRDTRFVDVPGNQRPEGARIVWFESETGLALRACLAPAPKRENGPRGTVIVCPGRTEFIEKYFETARDLQARGFAVLILDWPGQGLSERLLPDARKGHIDTFDTFMSALATGLEAVAADLPRPYVCLAHSMGGAIALAAIADEKVKVAAAAFCAPMWGLRSRFAGMKYLAWAMKTAGQGSAFVMKPGPHDSFEANIVTHDKARWAIQEALLEARPGLALGPVTWAWLGASLDIIDRFVKPEALAHVTCPVFVATAEEEALVDNASHEAICALLPDARRVIVPGARHEILMETDARRAQFWDGFDAMLERAEV